MPPQDGEEIAAAPRRSTTCCCSSLRNPGAALYRETIYEQRVGRGAAPASSRTVDLHVQRLRKKVGLGEEACGPFSKVGYRLEAEP